MSGRPIRGGHPGKHRYAFRLGVTRRGRAAVRIAPRPGSYPTAGQGQLALFAAGDVA